MQSSRLPSHKATQLRGTKVSLAGADAVRNALVRALTGHVAALEEGGGLTIAEFAGLGIVVWEVRRDRAGTPRCQFWPAVPWSSLYIDGSSPSDQDLARLARSETGSGLVLVCSSPDGPYATDAFERLRAAHPQVPDFHYTAPLADVLRHVLAHDPLTRPYELVVLRHTRSGRLALEGCQLFPHGAGRGYRETLTIRCEATGGDGTVFAVFATEKARRFQLVSTESIDLAAGSYTITAELRGPGLVRFDGLPGPLREDSRSWAELVAAVPARLEVPRPAHLICAVEVSGTKDQVAERLSRIEQLIGAVADEAKDQTRISLISYGPHSFDRAVPDVPPAVLIWAGTSDETLFALKRLMDRGAVDIGYPRAAQLECVLGLIAGRLDDREGRPVVVTVGARPPSPRQVDPATEILPCPYRQDWRRAWHRLLEFPGISFGAIRDHGQDEEIWTSLGSGALAAVNAVNVRRFAGRLGLLSSAAQYVPFPLVETEGD
jgi:hypothetical protein